MNTTEKNANSLKELLLARIEGVEKAVDVAHQDLVRVPTEVQKAVGTLKELHEEKFLGVAQRFTDNKLALDAAFKSQQDVMSKSEAANTKQIDAQGLLITNLTQGLQLQISDLKDRLTRIEGQSTGRKDFWGYVVGGIGLIAVVISIFFSFKR